MWPRDGGKRGNGRGSGSGGCVSNAPAWRRPRRLTTPFRRDDSCKPSRAEGPAEEQIKSLRAKIVRLQDGGYRALVLIDLIISALRALETPGMPYF